MQHRTLGPGGPSIAPWILGGNVFGWTADRATSFAVLDAFLEAGFDTIDTADVYSAWAPGNKGGESETIIGAWLADRGVRDRVVLMTKGGWGEGLRAARIEAACEASLRRLGTDRIDVYFAHKPDAKTPIEETLEAHQRLIQAGKVRAVGGSNYDAAGLGAALAASGGARARFDVLQPHYNLLVRDKYEGELEALCAAEGLGVVPYFALASGFLTGKYRTTADLGKSWRGADMHKHFTPRGLALLDALDRVAARHQATPAQIALAWLMARPSVTAPIASATSVAQVHEIARATHVALTAEDLAELTI